MFLNALVAAVPVRSELDRAALSVHSTMLEHGFVCVAAGEPPAGAAPAVATGTDGSTSLQILPPGWNAAADSYAFGYVHPLRGATETFTVKALSMGESLVVHAASSAPGAELLTVTLSVNRSATADEAQLKTWQEKTAASIAVRLLGLHNSTVRLGKALEGGAPAAERAAAGTKRPAPEEERGSRLPPRGDPEPEKDPRYQPGGLPVPGGPRRDPFSPGFLDPERRPPLFWTPDGGLLGPRHPAWGHFVPGRGGGMMPRFDPIGPGAGEPDPDHLRVPGLLPGGGEFPGFHGGAAGRGRGRLDPDGMFIL
uniref:PI31 proteasome regulator N-terminal domain-containing protein n=1 Tax=Pyrodinium bahamense TaxID=73915 RepID=A0A7R9ZZS8_9DINO|mmetsp:Transcript_16291/g.44872  ORF Transcript_16291/g.44872 Transcript_16291/m.44872 type:complete len:310 (+) Transcript_16291:108-1037(+)